MYNIQKPNNFQFFHSLHEKQKLEEKQNILQNAMKSFLPRSEPSTQQLEINSGEEAFQRRLNMTANSQSQAERSNECRILISNQSIIDTEQDMIKQVVMDMKAKAKQYGTVNGGYYTNKGIVVTLSSRKEAEMALQKMQNRKYLKQNITVSIMP